MPRSHNYSTDEKKFQGFEREKYAQVEAQFILLNEMGNPGMSVNLDWSLSLEKPCPQRRGNPISHPSVDG